jgi:hypothetical protein
MPSALPSTCTPTIWRKWAKSFPQPCCAYWDRHDGNTWGLAADPAAAAYLLHILWRQIAARSPVAIAAFIAGYFLLATMFRLSEPYQVLRPIWLPLVYSYAWLAIAAAIWLPATASASRAGCSFPGESPRITALLPRSSLGLGCLDLSVSGLAPDGCLCDAAADDRGDQLLLYRVFLLVLLRNKQGRLSWGVLLASTLLSPLLCMLGGWLAPILLGWT